jgi:hypothetical protein
MFFLRATNDITTVRQDSIDAPEADSRSFQAEMGPSFGLSTKELSNGSEGIPSTPSLQIAAPGP